MSTLTFDSLELVKKLQESGIPQPQAEAIVIAISEAQHQLVTKPDLEIGLAPIKTDLAVLKWMLGVMLAGVVSLVMKAFF